MRIAVVGAGIAGLMTAHLLGPFHDVVVFEADERAGGHTHTVPVTIAGVTHAVDTGFVVFDEGTYPRFTRLLAELGIASQPTEMSFSVRCTETGLEYGGRSLGALLAQPGNAVRPAFHRLLRDVVRFNREAAAVLERSGDAPTLAEWLDEEGYSSELRDQYLVPMAAAIWSARSAHVLAMPVDRVVAFFRHHGLLQVSGQPQWRTITGGAARYVDALTSRLRQRPRLGCAVTAVRRHETWVEVRTSESERFDAVVLAVHGSQALRLLVDPSADERAILSAFREDENEGVLHTDASVLPAARRAWCSWNVHLGRRGDRVGVTYDMRRLQHLASPEPICVTLNDTAGIDPARVVRRLAYRHPIYTRDAFAAQARHATISGVRRTYFCGAWWGYGFHEDGVESAVAVCRQIDPGVAT